MPTSGNRPLISRRAKQRGFRGQDLDDAIQRCAIAVIAFQFDASRSNGAAESTVLTAVVDRQLLALRRAKVRREQHVEAYIAGTTDVTDVTPSLQLSIDIRQVMDALPTQTRRICMHLLAGASVSAVARQLDVSWHTVRRHVELIRQKFEAAGLSPVCSREAT